MGLLDWIFGNQGTATATAIASGVEKEEAAALTGNIPMMCIDDYDSCDAMAMGQTDLSVQLSIEELGDDYDY